MEWALEAFISGDKRILDRRETERIREGKVQEHCIEPLTAEKRESLSKRFCTDYLELLIAPLRKEIQRELSVDVIVFDEERFDHLTTSLSHEPLYRFLGSRSGLIVCREAGD